MTASSAATRPPEDERCNAPLTSMRDIDTHLQHCQQELWLRCGYWLQGAFSVAAKAGVPVVPITLVGTGRKMPNRQESKVFPGNVEVVVHPQVPPASADEMMEKSRAAVLSGLPPEMQPLGP